MRTFKIYNPETGYIDRIKAKDHADAARRWGKIEFDSLGRSEDILVSGLREQTAKAFRVKVGIVVEDLT